MKILWLNAKLRKPSDHIEFWITNEEGGQFQRICMSYNPTGSQRPGAFLLSFKGRLFFVSIRKLFAISIHSMVTILITDMHNNIRVGPAVRVIDGKMKLALRIQDFVSLISDFNIKDIVGNATIENELKKTYHSIKDHKLFYQVQ